MRRGWDCAVTLLQVEGSESTSSPIYSLRVGGFTPLTTIDYPGELAAVVFCQGCPWRCRYCHNQGLLPRHAAHPLAWKDIMGFLERRRGLLDAVVFSGGEPTLQRGLPGAVAEARDLGFKVGVHSAGCYPERLAALLPQVDWVGLDIKALPDDYPALTGARDSGRRAWESLEHVVANAVNYEVRVTLHEALLLLPRLEQLLTRLAAQGVRRLALQACRANDWPETALESSRNMTEDPGLCELLKDWEGRVTLRA